MPALIPRAPGTQMSPIPSRGPSPFGRAGGSGGAGGGGGRTPPLPTPQAPAPAPPVPAAPLTLTAQPSPEMAAALEAWKKRQAELAASAGRSDEGLQFQVEQYKKRLGSDTTERAIGRAASAIRDQMAGLNAGAEAQGSAMGRGQGFGAEGIAEAGQRALAGQSADIALGRERDLDQLVMAGQNIMAAPGTREFAYQQAQNQFYSQNPYLATANLGLSQQELALRAYQAQQQAQNEAARTQAQIYGSPYQMFQTLYGGF